MEVTVSKCSPYLLVSVCTHSIPSRAEVHTWWCLEISVRLKPTAATKNSGSYLIVSQVLGVRTHVRNLNADSPESPRGLWLFHHRSAMCGFAETEVTAVTLTPYDLHNYLWIQWRACCMRSGGSPLCSVVQEACTVLCSAFFVLEIVECLWCPWLDVKPKKNVLPKLLLILHSFAIIAALALFALVAATFRVPQI